MEQKDTVESSAICESTKVKDAINLHEAMKLMSVFLFIFLNLLIFGEIYWYFIDLIIAL